MQLKSRTIVVGLDFSELADRAFRQAFELAAVSSTSEIHAIFVMSAAAVDPFTGFDAVQPSTVARMEEGATRLSKHVNELLFTLGARPRLNRCVRPVSRREKRRRAKRFGASNIANFTVAGIPITSAIA
jgi:nucleotide-binding universal stress UspA family protein